MHHLGWQAKQRPDAIAVIESGGRTVTYAQLDERSRHLAGSLAALGLKPRDAIALRMPNGAAFLEVAWAAQRSGLFYSPVNTHLRPAEIDALVGDRLVVTEEVYERLLAGPAGDPPQECEGRELLFSGGTTGLPKPVPKPLSAGPMGDPADPVVQLALGLAHYGLGPDSVYLSPAPLYHAAPLVYCMSVLRLGGTLVLMDRFDPAACLELIGRHRVTHAQFVPTMFVRMLKLPEEQRRACDLSSLRVVFHSAAPCPVEVKHRMLDWFGPIIHEYYSGTEGYGHTAIGPQEWLAHPGSVGKAGADVSIRDGVVYFGDHTLGDVGHVDEDGYLYLTDRIAHMIVSGGVNIYPQETENVLVMHPRVADVAVIGVPDPEMGERVLAVVEPAGDVTEEELLAYCRDRLAAYKCPRGVEFTRALPRDPSGKLRKGLLREAYWRDHDTRII